MPTIRQSLTASLTRRYPFYSGRARFANSRFVQGLAGPGAEAVWARVPGGEVLARLDDFLGRTAFYVGDIDGKLTWICSRIVRPGDTVLDIGANIGTVTIWLSALVGEKGKVHSFEPNPTAHKALQLLIERNKSANICLHPVALGEEEGSLDLVIPPTDRKSVV